jgi:benzoyl-CoA reductase subunit D
VITAGIDAGARTVKAVILRDGKIAGRAIEPAGTDTESAANAVCDAALREAGIARRCVEKIMAAGAGRKRVSFAHGTITAVTAAAKGAHALFPEAGTVIGIGAEEALAVKLDENGKIVDFAVNDKCAAGAGAFTEAMARALDTTVEELGPLSLKSTRAVKISAQCAVFAESEVVALVHARIPPEDIARAVLDSISERTASMVRRIGVNGKVVLAGGMAKNTGFVQSLGRSLGCELHVPGECEFACAFGAALAAAK